MPLARYFFCVGAALLVLLFIVDFFLPQSPLEQKADADPPTIRIHSDRKWPERVVYDTNIPTIIPAAPANGEIAPPPPPVIAGVSPNTREAFAQLQPSDPAQRHASDPKQTERKPQRQRHAAVRRRWEPPARPMWRQPQFAWYGFRIW